MLFQRKKEEKDNQDKPSNKGVFSKCFTKKSLFEMIMQNAHANIGKRHDK